MRKEKEWPTGRYVLWAAVITAISQIIVALIEKFL